MKESFEEILIDNEIYTISVDELQKIRIAINKSEGISDKLVLGNLVKLVMDINSLPMDSEDRDKYKRDIANIYQIGLNDGEKLAKDYAHNLKEIVEKNLLIKRKRDLFQPVIIGFICIIMASICFVKTWLGEFYHPIIFGSIGGIVSVIIQNNKLNIDYQVDKKLLKFEAFKLVLLSITMAIIGSIAIRSKFILGNIQGKDGEYFMFLIYVLCGYSQTFIPNILKNLEARNEKKFNEPNDESDSS